MLPDELRNAIEDVESAIFEDALTGVANDDGDLRNIEHASRELLRLQIDKLNYPSFAPHADQNLASLDESQVGYADGGLHLHPKKGHDKLTYLQGCSCVLGETVTTYFLS
jgi:hypothetical protein